MSVAIESVNEQQHYHHHHHHVLDLFLPSPPHKEEKEKEKEHSIVDKTTATFHHVVQEIVTLLNRTTWVTTTHTTMEAGLAWVQEELNGAFHQFERVAVEPLSPYLQQARNVVQPYLPDIPHVVNDVVLPWIPEIHDENTREQVIIAFVAVMLSLLTLFCFRNPRHRQRRPAGIIRSTKRQQRKNNNSNHNRQQQQNQQLQILWDGSPIRKRTTSRPTNADGSPLRGARKRTTSRATNNNSTHRGSDDSATAQMSKDGSLRSRLSSFDMMSFRRKRLASLDPYWGADHDLFVEHDTTTTSATTTATTTPRGGGSGGGERDGDGSGIDVEDFDLSLITYYGPNESKICYSAWTPPLTWAEASRRVIPQDTTRRNLQRQLVLDVGKMANLKVVEGSNVTTATLPSFGLPISEWSVHVRTPVEGGVLELYIKNTPKDDWLELTFTSAHACAQFQLDLLAYQVFGKTLNSLYQALEIVHQGSVAYPGKEFVLHDTEHGDTPASNMTTTTTTTVGVAWDDAMRALNALPSIRLSLERLLVAQRQRVVGNRPRVNSEASVPASPKASDAADATSDTTPPPALSLTEEYMDKRLMLGPVDFFRLFVPFLPHHTLPQSTNRESRVEHLLRWRKRVARASVLVQAYVRARTLVNRGWNLRKALPEQYLVRRLAYDDNDENQRRDDVSKNEYYEATVSRDVRCGVRSGGGCTSTTSTIGSGQRHALYQAYALVGCHVFRLPKPERWHKHSLRPNRDPVEALPSLRALISSHPEEDFMVNAFYFEGIRTAMVQVYVRSLPKGIDPKFDTTMKKYTEGSKVLRDSMLHALAYLGQSRNQSFSSWLALRVLFYLLSFSRRCRLLALPKPTMSSDFFFSLPAVMMSHFCETFHYGGGIVSDSLESNLPSNYVAMNANIDSRHMPNALARFLHSHIERGVLADTTMDFTLMLESLQEDELPERALSTIRMVHISPTQVALPISYSSFYNDASLRGEAEVQPTSDRQLWVPNPWAIWSLAKIFIVHPLNELASYVVPRSSKIGNNATDSQLMSPSSLARSIYLSASEDDDMNEDFMDVPNDEDVVEAAITTIVEILCELKVPVRKRGLTAEELTRAEPIPESFEWVGLPPGVHREDFTSVNVLYRSTRSDVKRFLMAAEGDVHTAAVRLAESVTWRSFTFPVNTRTCRIELQNGQFFQKGTDRDGNPVFYFRNMCLGPWRKDENAVISAVLHRLESSLQAYFPSVKITLIILMRRPYKRSKKEPGDASSVSEKVDEEGEAEKADDGDNEPDDDDDEEDGDGVVTETDKSNVHDDMDLKANPRLPEDERYYLHTNTSLIRKLVDILMRHYPERLSRALIVPSIGNVSYFRTVVGGRVALASVVGSIRTRSKVKFLKHFSELKIYVKTDELVTIVGGTNPMDPAVFEAI